MLDSEIHSSGKTARNITLHRYIRQLQAAFAARHEPARIIGDLIYKLKNCHRKFVAENGTSAKIQVGGCFRWLNNALIFRQERTSSYRKTQRTPDGHRL